MRPVLSKLLWIGNAVEARDIQSVLSLGVTAVVDLAANEIPIQYPRDITYCRFPLNDGLGNHQSLLRLAVETTAELVRSRVPTLVTCSAGMSRSPAVVAAALAIAEQRDADEILLQIASEGPHDVSPALWQEIKRSILSEKPAFVSCPSLKLIVLKTSQTQALLSFYIAIGMTLTEEKHGSGPVHHSAVLGQTVFEIYSQSGDQEEASAVRLGFAVGNFQQTLAKLRQIGITIASEPKATPWGQRAVVRDPDGRAVELYDQ